MWNTVTKSLHTKNTINILTTMNSGREAFENWICNNLLFIINF